MKKFYAFAAAAFMAATAFAQNGAPLYAVGAGEGLAEWTPEEPTEFAYADGKYTLEIQNLTMFKISTVKGAWAEWDTGVLGCNYGDEAGVAVALEPGYTENILPPGKGDYTITVAGDLSTITLEAQGEIVSGPTTLYLRGDLEGTESWSAEEEWALTELINGVYTFKCADGQSIPAETAFKIADADWAVYNYGGDADPFVIMAETETEVFAGGGSKNMTLAEDWSGVMYFILDLDGSAYVWFGSSEEDAPEWAVEATTGVKGVEVEENAAPVYYNLQGIRVANPENGVFIVVKGNKVSKVVR
ncbi:MAG: hypothetical protein K2G90_05275 [Muribaculaceae bacterium]|nr:hypothetical protein [Muribaculaceae bacterium]